jgi:hypothetical protein
VPGIGPIIPSAFVAVPDVASRFERARQVTSYLGLVQQEYSSGEKQQRGCVMRSAHPQGQSLLREPPDESGVPQILAPPPFGGGRTESPAAGEPRWGCWPSRRVARTLFAMWRDETDFEPARIRMGRSDDHVTTATTAAVPMQFSEVVKLERQARILVWLLFESRASEGAAPPSNPPVRRHVT